jgi:1-acyl-sn-glycerol-3-phosphate acyltransferase
MGEAEVIRIDDRARSRAERTAGKPRCRATTISGRACRNSAVTGDGYCHVHGGERARAAHPSSAARAGRGEDGTLDRVLSFFRGNPGASLLSRDRLVRSLTPHWFPLPPSFLDRRMRGNYPIDDFGYDEDLSREVLLKLVRPLYENYFRGRTIGIDRIPAEGPALLVGNHSGAIALDAVMMQVAVASKHPQARAVRNVGADLVFKLPFVGHLARKTGTVLACDEDTIELIHRGELVGVFPEGYKGVGKGWRDRYRLQRFGRGGFIEIALKTGCPIIPVAIVGAEEAYPMIYRSRLLARAFGAPYFPITPTFPLLGPLGVLPLPSRWVIEFGEPIAMEGFPEDASDDKMLVFDLADDIRDRVQQMLFKSLKLRGSAFL